MVTTFSLTECTEDAEILLKRALMFRQDYRINKIFLPFLPPAPLPARGVYRPEGRAYASERRTAKSIIPLQGKAFNHYANKTVKQWKKHPLLAPRPFFPLKRNCVFSASSGSRKKNQVNPVNPVRKHFGFMYK